MKIEDVYVSAATVGQSPAGNLRKVSFMGSFEMEAQEAEALENFFKSVAVDGKFTLNINP